PADELPELAGELSVYLGRGEGGLYEQIVEAIRERSPELALELRRGSSSGLANTLVAEGRHGGARADLFWSIDASSLGYVVNEGLTRPVPASLHEPLPEAFRFKGFAPISGRVRSIAYNPERVQADDLPERVMDLAGTDLKIGWAPSYGACQSFLTAMRLLEGEGATREWMETIQGQSRAYAGELGAVMAAAQGEVDLALANHYYTLRLKEGQPDLSLELAFTRGDAGSLVNTAGAALLSDSETAVDFVRYLHSREVQGFLAEQAFEIPLAGGVESPSGIPAVADLEPPELDLTQLGDVQPTLDLMRQAGVL
ncbi:MAG: substrate-binding domain-containing protein, partial [Thiohalospira sp.]